MASRESLSLRRRRRFYSNSNNPAANRVRFRICDGSCATAVLIPTLTPASSRLPTTYFCYRVKEKTIFPALVSNADTPPLFFATIYRGQNQEKDLAAFVCPE